MEESLYSIFRVTISVLVHRELAKPAAQEETGVTPAARAVRLRLSCGINQLPVGRLTGRSVTAHLQTTRGDPKIEGGGGGGVTTRRPHIGNLTLTAKRRTRGGAVAPHTRRGTLALGGGGTRGDSLSLERGPQRSNTQQLESSRKTTRQEGERQQSREVRGDRTEPDRVPRDAYEGRGDSRPLSRSEYEDDPRTADNRRDTSRSIVSRPEEGRSHSTRQSDDRHTARRGHDSEDDDEVQIYVERRGDSRRTENRHDDDRTEDARRDGNQKRGSIVDENRVGRDRSSVNRDSGYRYNEPADVDDQDK